MAAASDNIAKDLAEIHDKNAVIAVAMHHDQKAWREGYHTFLEQRKHHAEQAKQQTGSHSASKPIQSLEATLENFPALKSFAERVEKEEIAENAKELKDFEISFFNLQDNKPLEDTTQIRLLKLLFRAIKEE